MSTGHSDRMIPRVFILGSCATRDAISFAGDGLHLSGYLARTSLASAFQDSPAPKSLLRFLDRIDSNFQKRMVKIDLLKLAGSILREAEFDYLLLDLIDERFNLAKFRGRNGLQSFFTLSAEFYKAYGSRGAVGSIIRSGSAEHWDAWRAGVDRLFAMYSPARVILNKVYWAEKANDGSTLGQPWDIDKENQWLYRMYEYLERDSSIKSIDYGAGFLADPGHRWGLAPFHYDQAVYRQTISGVMKIVDQDSDRDKEV